MPDIVTAGFDPPNTVAVVNNVAQIVVNDTVVVVVPPPTSPEVITVASPGPQGAAASAAINVSYDDTLTMLGVGNIQDAIVALYALIGGGPTPGPGGQLDFSTPLNSALIGLL